MRNIICVLGSGGHTYEILLILKRIWNKINKCCFIVGRDDWISLENIKKMRCREGIRILKCYRPTVVKEKNLKYIFMAVLVCILVISISIFIFIFFHIFKHCKDFTLLKSLIFDIFNSLYSIQTFLFPTAYLLRSFIFDIFNSLYSIQTFLFPTTYLLRNFIFDTYRSIISYNTLYSSMFISFFVVLLPIWFSTHLFGTNFHVKIKYLIRKTIFIIVFPITCILKIYIYLILQTLIPIILYHIYLLKTLLYWFLYLVRLLISILDCIILSFKVKNDYEWIICNGPGLCCVICIIFKYTRGMKICYIESITRSERLSLTGQIMEYISDEFYVQNDKLVQNNRIYKNFMFSE